MKPKVKVGIYYVDNVSNREYYYYVKYCECYVSKSVNMYIN